ncbi:MAG: Uma2 family endonuclease [Planctomycetota bacterium]
MTTATTTTAPPTASSEARPRHYRLGQEFLAELGDVPVERIIFDPPPGTVTEAQFIEFNESKRFGLAELVNGTLIQKAMGQFESAVGFVLGRILGNWQEEHMPGVLTGEQTMLRMRAGNIRMPDIAFYPKSQFPDGRFPREKVGAYPALLAVEILSESNTPAEIDMKLREYFGSGTQLVWVVDPVSETVRIYDNPDKPGAFRQIENTDTLDGGEVLPNFSIPVAKIFNI